MYIHAKHYLTLVLNTISLIETLFIRIQKHENDERLKWIKYGGRTDTFTANLISSDTNTNSDFQFQ